MKAGAGINCGPAAETNQCRRSDDCPHNISLDMLLLRGDPHTICLHRVQILTKILGTCFNSGTGSKVSY